MALAGGLIVLVGAAGMISFRAMGQIDRPVKAVMPAGVVAVPASTKSPEPMTGERVPLSPAPQAKPEDPRDALPPLAPPPGGLAPEAVKRGAAPGRLAPDGVAPKNGDSRSRTPREVAPPVEREPEPDASAVATHAADVARATADASAITFDGLHLVTGFDEDDDAEEADAHLVLHADRFTIVDDDAERVVHEIHFSRTPSPASSSSSSSSASSTASTRSGQAMLSGTVRLQRGSEMWLILPASTGRVVLRVDSDEATRLANEIERRVGKAVTWTSGELTRTP